MAAVEQGRKPSSPAYITAAAGALQSILFDKIYCV
ncbi:MAG: hypothetical protein M3408_12675 [Actinomycetota bacterium]|nr:hypothetical protein [Actinomycetota bacterium]